MVAADIDVFAYLDYRAFLREYYRARKAAGRGFSYRSFSRRAGLRSPNYLKLVVDGARNLSSDMAERFASACGLCADEQKYFVELVAFGQAANAADRNRRYARLARFERFRSVHKLSALRSEDAAYESAVSSLSVCLGEAGLRSLQERVQRFHADLLELAALESQPQQVLQISIQLLPLSRASHD
jgi:hypothetical protein